MGMTHHVIQCLYFEDLPFSSHCIFTARSRKLIFVNFLCRIYDSVTKCLLDAVSNQATFNTYCSTSNLQVFKDMVSDFKQLLGCTNEANYGKHSLFIILRARIHNDMHKYLIKRSDGENIGKPYL